MSQVLLTSVAVFSRNLYISNAKHLLNHLANNVRFSSVLYFMGNIFNEKESYWQCASRLLMSCGHLRKGLISWLSL